MTIAEATTGTNETTGAKRLHESFAGAGSEGRAAFIPYVVAGYPDPDTSVRVALAVADAGADILEIGLPYSDPLADGATLQRASQVALRAGASLDGSLRLIERIGAERPDLPLVPMGYANQVIGGGDGEAVLRRLAGAGAAGVIVADLTPDEGAAFETVARGVGVAVIYLVAPTTSAGAPCPDRRAERGIPLLRVAHRVDRCAVGAGARGPRARRRCPLGLAGAGRGRVRHQHAGARRGDRESRCGRRRRRVRLGGLPWGRWAGP